MKIQISRLDQTYDLLTRKLFTKYLRSKIGLLMLNKTDIRRNVTIKTVVSRERIIELSDTWENRLKGGIYISYVKSDQEEYSNLPEVRVGVIKDHGKGWRIGPKVSDQISLTEGDKKTRMNQTENINIRKSTKLRFPSDSEKRGSDDNKYQIKDPTLFPSSERFGLFVFESVVVIVNDCLTNRNYLMNLRLEVKEVKNFSLLI